MAERMRSTNVESSSERADTLVEMRPQLEIGFGRPRGELPQTQLEHPRIELDDQAGLLGDVDEVVRGRPRRRSGNTMRARDSTERMRPWSCR